MDLLDRAVDFELAGLLFNQAGPVAKLVFVHGDDSSRWVKERGRWKVRRVRRSRSGFPRWSGTRAARDRRFGRLGGSGCLERRLHRSRYFADDGLPLQAFFLLRLDVFKRSLLAGGFPLRPSLGQNGNEME